MNEKNLRIISVAAVVLIISLSLYFINQPLTNLTIKEKQIDIVCLSPTQSLISYRKDGSVIIKTSKKTNKDKNISISAKQKAMEIYSNFSKEIKNEVFYFEIFPKEYAQYITETIFKWKKNPFILPKLIKTLSHIKTNLSFGDKITAISLLLRTNPSHIILVNSEENPEPTVKNSNLQITVELINSKSDKATMKKVIEKLRKENIDIIDQKNSNSYSQTMLITNTLDNYEKAIKIMEILGIKNKEIYIEKNFMLGDVKIIIAKDYKGE